MFARINVPVLVFAVILSEHNDSDLNQLGCQRAKAADVR